MEACWEGDGGERAQREESEQTGANSKKEPRSANHRRGHSGSQAVVQPWPSALSLTAQQRDRAGKAGKRKDNLSWVCPEAPLAQAAALSSR